MEKESKDAGIHMFLIRKLLKGIHAWMYHLPPPDISQKTQPVHKLVQEAYDDQSLIRWNHAMRDRVSRRWSEAQTLHNKTRKSKNENQGRVAVWIIWLAMKRLWLLRNGIEHRATEEERPNSKPHFLTRKYTLFCIFNQLLNYQCKLP